MSELGAIRFTSRFRQHLRRLEPGTRCCHHSDHILALHRAEGGHVGLGDEYWPVQGPFICLLPAGDTDNNDMHGHDDAWWCAFAGSAVSSVDGGARLALAGMVVTQPRFQVVSQVQERRARVLFQDLRSTLAAGGLGGELVAQARLRDLLGLWLEAGSPPADDAVDRFRRLITAEAWDPERSLEELARRVSRHPDSLSAAFRRRYGCTPVSFRTRLRLERARELLATGATGPAGAAAACGFPDPGYFARVFRRHVGMTPGEWARRFGPA